MRARLATFLAPLAILALTTATAQIEPCASPEITTPETGVSFTKLVHGEEGTGTYYVDNDLCQFDGCTFSIWIYEETNGIPGLQRGDEVYEPIPGCAPPDTIIF